MSLDPPKTTLTDLTALWLSADSSHQLPTLPHMLEQFAAHNPWQPDESGMSAVDALWRVLMSSGPYMSFSKPAWRALLTAALAHPCAPAQLADQPIKQCAGNDGRHSGSSQASFEDRSWPAAIASVSDLSVLSAYRAKGHRLGVKDAKGFTPIAYIPWDGGRFGGHEGAQSEEMLKQLFIAGCEERFDMADCDYPQAWNIRMPSRLSDLQKRVGELRRTMTPPAGFDTDVGATFGSFLKCLKRGDGLTVVRTAAAASNILDLAEKHPTQAATLLKSAAALMAAESINARVPLVTKRQAGYEWFVKNAARSKEAVLMPPALRAVAAFMVLVRKASKEPANNQTPSLWDDIIAKHGQAEQDGRLSDQTLDILAENGHLLSEDHVLFAANTKFSQHAWEGLGEFQRLKGLPEQVKEFMFSSTTAFESATACLAASNPTTQDLVDLFEMVLNHASPALMDNLARRAKAWRAMPPASRVNMTVTDAVLLAVSGQPPGTNNLASKPLEIYDTVMLLLKDSNKSPDLGALQRAAADAHGIVASDSSRTIAAIAIEMTTQWTLRHAAQAAAAQPKPIQRSLL